MSKHFGFGRETTPGPAVPFTRMYPVLTSTQESCAICERVDERDRMHYVSYDDDGFGLYVCDAAHPMTSRNTEETKA